MKRKIDDLLPSTSAEDEAPPSSITQKGGAGDQDLVTAAEALTQLTRSVSPNPEDGASTLASPMSSTSLSEMDQQPHPIVQSVTAVSKLPIVTNAVRYYESSKRNYATFNYAAEIVEKAAMPVFNKIEVNLNSMHMAKLQELRRQKKRRIYGATPVTDASEQNETKRRLRFCLHILKLANDNISSKVDDLQHMLCDSEEVQSSQEKTVQLATPEKDSRAVVTEKSVSDPESDILSNEVTAVSSNVPEEAQETRIEIVSTVKKIIHVISNFRPSTLSGHEVSTDEGVAESEERELKSTIRDIILNLPTQIQQSATPSQALQATDRVLVFAKESLNMISKLTNVFSEQLEKAESWVEGDEMSAAPVRSPLSVSSEVHDS